MILKWYCTYDIVPTHYYGYKNIPDTSSANVTLQFGPQILSSLKGKIDGNKTYKCPFDKLIPYRPNSLFYSRIILFSTQIVLKCLDSKEGLCVFISTEG